MGARPGDERRQHILSQARVAGHVDVTSVADELEVAAETVRRDLKLLEEHGILYTPDYVVNAGGVIQVADEIEGYQAERARLRATGIFDTTRRLLRLADEEKVPPAVAADRLAERRMAEVGRLRSVFVR